MNGTLKISSILLDTAAAQGKEPELQVFWVVLAILLFFLFAETYVVKRKDNKLKELQADKDSLAEEYGAQKKILEQLKEEKGLLAERLEEVKKSDEKNHKIAYTDLITGLPNRGAFTEMLEGVIKTLRKDEVFALMSIDLDNFKVINEILGHSYGDELLIDVTDRLKQAMDDNDYLACFGGDEFTVITQNMEEINDYTDKLKKIQNVFSYPFTLAAREIFVTISIGVCIAPRDGKTSALLLKNMDSALHFAKENGKNTYCFFEESINKELMDKIALQAQLRSAIENKEFLVYYQPQVNLSDNTVVGFEALVRWNHPTRGIVMPSEFMDTAEETGLILPIGHIVLKEACSQLREWQQGGFDSITISVNLSARQFKDARLLDLIKETADETGVKLSGLIFEITENTALENMKYSMDIMEKLTQMGAGISLHNFGAGYSAMNYLKYLPIRSLKIDKSQLDDIEVEETSRAIISAVIRLTEAMGIQVVAEGVESGTQEQFLKKEICSIGQGFLYSEPVSGEEAGDMLNLIQNGGRLEDFYWK